MDFGFKIGLEKFKRLLENEYFGTGDGMIHGTLILTLSSRICGRNTIFELLLT